MVEIKVFVQDEVLKLSANGAVLSQSELLHVGFIKERVSLKLTSVEGELLVHASHSGLHRSPMWMLGASSVNEDTPFPDWNVSLVGNSLLQSPCMVIKCPKDVKIEVH